MGQKINFGEQLEKDAKEHGVASGKADFFRFEEGSNKVRILSVWSVIAQHFMGKKSKPAVCYGIDEGCPHHGEDTSPAQVKWLLWLLDYKDSKIKLAQLPYTVIQAIGELQKTEEYGFEEVPMPYDIDIKAKNAGTKEVEYTVIPARQNSELDEKVLFEFESKKSPDDIVSAMKEKAKKGDTGEE